MNEITICIDTSELTTMRKEDRYNHYLINNQYMEENIYLFYFGECLEWQRVQTLASLASSGNP